MPVPSGTIWNNLRSGTSPERRPELPHICGATRFHIEALLRQTPFLEIGLLLVMACFVLASLPLLLSVALIVPELIGLKDPGGSLVTGFSRSPSRHAFLVNGTLAASGSSCAAVSNGFLTFSEPACILVNWAL